MKLSVKLGAAIILMAVSGRILAASAESKKALADAKDSLERSFISTFEKIGPLIPNENLGRATEPYAIFAINKVKEYVKKSDDKKLMAEFQKINDKAQDLFDFLEKRKILTSANFESALKFLDDNQGKLETMLKTFRGKTFVSSIKGDVVELLEEFNQQMFNFYSRAYNDCRRLGCEPGVKKVANAKARG